MGPPSVPAPGAAPTHSQAQPHRSPVISTSEQAGMPLRHPRPLTAAELYLECEKEQEAVVREPGRLELADKASMLIDVQVNRLTRELSALRAQSASVASNASQSSNSTTASLLPVDISDPNPTHQLIGATHPTPSRRHRSSSSLSARSTTTPSTSVSGPGSNVSTHVQTGSAANVPVGGLSQASVDRAAALSGPNISRQPSVSASGTSTPARQSADFPRHAQQPPTLHTLPLRPSLSRDQSYASQVTSSTTAQAGTPAPHPIASPATSPGVGLHAAMQHYADTAAYRSEMEIVKAENDALRQRVRALEGALRARRRDSSQSDAARPDPGAVRSDAGYLRQSRDGISPSASLTSPSGAGIAAWAAGGGGVGGVAGPRERSESQSTTASSRRGVAADEEVRVGESAASVWTGRGV